MKQNYYKLMQKAIEDIPAGETLLLHSCCGPCSSSVLETLASHFTVVLYYHNPNIWPPEEFAHRSLVQQQLIAALPTKYPVAFVEAPYIPQEFYTAIQGVENEPEGGLRCKACFEIRIKAAAKEAVSRNIQWFTTTLSVSPHKNAQLLNYLGATIAEQYNLQFLPSDFKKAEGYKRSIELSKQYNLYRQNYCGCEYSYRDENSACRTCANKCK